jgi:ribosomal protein S12 methylthiotransferase accessory factor
MSGASEQASLELSPHWFGVFRPGRWIVLFDGARVLRAPLPPQSRCPGESTANGRALELTPDRIAQLPTEHIEALRSAAVVRSRSQNERSCTVAPTSLSAEVSDLIVDLEASGPPHGTGFPIVAGGNRLANAIRTVFSHWKLAHASVESLDDLDGSRDASLRSVGPEGESAALDGRLSAPESDPRAVLPYLLYPTEWFWDPALRHAADLAERLGITFVPARLVRSRLLLGPLLSPGRPPCIECCRRRLLSRFVVNEETHALFASLFDGTEPRIRAAATTGGIASALSNGLRALFASAARRGEEDALAPHAMVTLEGGKVETGWLVAVDRCTAHGTAPPSPEDSDDPEDRPSPDDPLVDPQFGLIRSIADIAPPELAGTLTITSALSANLAPLTETDGAQRPCLSVSGGGVSANPQISRAKAVSEIVERTSLYLAPPPLGPPCAPTDLGTAAIPPDRWILFSERQYQTPGFPFVPFTRETRVGWCRARRLRDGAERLVPRAMVTGCHELAPGEAAIGAYTTSGQSTHRTRERAVLTGLFELIERDATMCCWLARMPGRRCVHARIPKTSSRRFDEAMTYTASLAKMGFSVESYQIPTDLPVHVVVTLGFRTDGRRPRFSFGAAARCTLEEAHHRSLEEACQFLGWDESGVPERFDAGADFCEVTGFVHHYLIFNNRESWTELAFLRSAEETVEVSPDDPADREADLPRLVGLLAARGFEVLDVAVPMFDAGAAGRVCHRVLVPGLHPVNENHAHTHLDLRRVRAVVEATGAPFPPEGENRFPHPIP